MPGFILKVENLSLKQLNLQSFLLPTLLLLTKDLSFVVGDKVTTIFGIGVVQTVKDDGMTTILLSNWIMADNKSPTLYMNPQSFEKIADAPVVKGDKVDTIFGQGFVDDIRDDGISAIILTNWKLANNQSPTLYMNSHSFKKIATKPISTNDMIKSAAAELFAKQKADREAAEKSVDTAVACKEAGARYFKAGDFAAAKMQYQEALGYAQGLQQEVSNELKARIFELCVPLHTNVALCAMKVKDYADSIVFAKNSLMLIDALSNKLKDSAIWRILQDRGRTQTKLLVDMKKKSLFLLGKAEYFSGRSDSAIFHFEQALAAIDWALGDLDKKDHLAATGDGESVVGGDVSIGSSQGDLAALDKTDAGGAAARTKRRKDLQREADDVRDFLVKAQKRVAAEAKKEKAMWSKAFNKNKAEPEPVTASVAAPIARSSTSGANLSGVDMKIDMSKLGLSSGTLSSGASPAAVSPQKKTVVAAEKSEDDEEENSAKKNALVTPNDSFIPLVITSCVSLLGIALFGLGWRYKWFKR